MAIQGRNPVWADADQTRVALEVMLSDGWSPFVTSPTDTEPFGQSVHQAAISGDFGPIGAYNAPAAEPLRYIDKMTMIERLSDDESDQLSAALSQASGKLQLLYASASRIDTQNPYYSTLYDAISTTLGSTERADEILEPTD